MRRSGPPSPGSWASNRICGAVSGYWQRSDYVCARAAGGTAHSIPELVGPVGPPALDGKAGRRRVTGGCGQGRGSLAVVYQCTSMPVADRDLDGI